MISKQDTDPFRLAVKQHFAFLADDFGFEEQTTPKNKNPFSVWYANDTSRIVVESISYGLNARVALGRSGPIDTFENYDLLDCVAVCSQAADVDPEAFPTGAFDQLSLMAGIVLDHVAHILRGDFDCFPEVGEIIKKRRLDWESSQK